MNLDALFKITYGLFVAGVTSGAKRGGCIINTASQVTAEPPRVIVTMQKQNYTAELIREKGSLALSILSRDCPMKVIQNFGYRSGRGCDKFSETAFTPDCLGNPVLSEHVCAAAALRVQETVDVDTHWLFICSVEDAAITAERPPLTYEDYRIVKSGGTLDGNAGCAPAIPKKHTCLVCHYTYDGDTPFEDLPDDWVCPICGVGKEQFALV